MKHHAEFGRTRVEKRPGRRLDGWYAVRLAVAGLLGVSSFGFAEIVKAEPSEPVAVPLPADWASLPERKRYTQGEEAPFGYVREERTLSQVWIPGAAAFTASYGGSLLYLSSRAEWADGERWLLVPVVGPFAAYASRTRCESCSTQQDDSGVLIVDGIFQVLGVAATVLGLNVTKTIWLRRDQISLRVEPVQLAGGGSGVSAVGRW